MSKESRRARGKAYAAYKEARDQGKVKISGKKFVNAYTSEGWKRRPVDIGKKNYTEGQKNFARAIDVIEERLGKVAADLKMKYGSDDIEELANQYYISDLADYTPSELSELEKEFNKTHGYHIKLEKAVNPFAGIDFLSMR